MRKSDENERQVFDAFADLLTSGFGLRLLRTVEMLAATYRTAPTLSPEADLAEAPPARASTSPSTSGGTQRAEPAQGTARRLVLLGESAAAGYLLSPDLTPAQALRAVLDRHAAEPWDVVDLAEVDLSASGLLDAARRAASLRPDVVVVFAGNNWPVRLRLVPPAGHLLPVEQALAFRAGGIGGLRRHTEAATARLSESTLLAVLRIVRASGARPVVVVPEVDRRTWGRARPVTWLTGDGVTRWHEAHQAAIAALHAGESDAALAAADAMLGLDGGHCPTTHRLRANALRRLGRLDEESSAARSEVDARAFDNDPTVPGATSLVQGVIRQVAFRDGAPIVDLPALFEADGAGGTHFLDYCHLAPRGIALLAAAVARAVLDEPGAAPLRATADEVCTLPPEKLARALLLAGLYAAHWSEPAGGEQEDRAQGLLTQALDLDPTLEAAMGEWVRTRVAPCEATLLSSAMQRLGEGLLAGLDPLWNVPGLDPDGLSRLARLHADLERQITEGLVGSDHDAGRRSVNLLDPAYLWNAPGERATRRFFGAGSHAFRRVVWPTADFALVADGERDLELQLTLRRPDPRPLAPEASEAPSQARKVQVLVNDRAIASFPVGNRWTRQTLFVPAHRLRPGLNRLRLAFPPPEARGELALGHIADALDLGYGADLHPRFGDIFRLDARPAS